jgi:glycerol-3-phosphate acyltransferase PlsY
MYPVWLSFKGGKGVATGAGAFLPILPVAAVTGLITFAVVARLSRYASVGSIVGASALPVVAMLMREPMPSRAAAAVAAALIVWKHRENVRRIAAGRERRLGAGTDGSP